MTFGVIKDMPLPPVDEKDKRIALLEQALSFYASPETYHAISILGDAPCGPFSEDFSEDHGDEFYNRPMPGKYAREVLSGALKGTLEVNCEVHGTALQVVPVAYCEKCTEEAEG